MRKIYGVIIKYHNYIYIGIIIPLMFFLNNRELLIVLLLVIFFISTFSAIIRKILSNGWHKKTENEKLNICFDFLSEDEKADLKYLCLGKLKKINARMKNAYCYVARMSKEFILVALDKSLAPIPNYYYRTNINQISKFEVQVASDKYEICLLVESKYVMYFDVYMHSNASLPIDSSSPESLVASLRL